jgi:hypothetical protein
MTLYLLRDLNDKAIYKFGVARNPRKRQRQIENASGRVLEPVVWVLFHHEHQALAAERFLLSMFQYASLPGEWFRFDNAFDRGTAFKACSELGRWPFEGEKHKEFAPAEEIWQELVKYTKDRRISQEPREVICL